MLKIVEVFSRWKYLRIEAVVVVVVELFKRKKRLLFALNEEEEIYSTSHDSTTIAPHGIVFAVAPVFSNTRSPAMTTEGMNVREMAGRSGGSDALDVKVLRDIDKFVRVAIADALYPCVFDIDITRVLRSAYPVTLRSAIVRTTMFEKDRRVLMAVVAAVGEAVCITMDDREMFGMAVNERAV